MLPEFTWRCEGGCGRRYRLLAKVWRHGTYRWLCADCWKDAGSPWPGWKEMTHEQEEAIRESMLRRGGVDAYRVRAGKT